MAHNGTSPNTQDARLLDETGDSPRPTPATPLMSVDVDSAPVESHDITDGVDWGYHLYVKDPDADEGAEGEEAEIGPDDVGAAFCGRSSLVGFTQIHESAGVVKKVFWFLVLILALSLLIFHTSSLVIRYIKFGTAIDLHVESQPIIQFPAVTVCNNNMLVVDPRSGIPPIQSTEKYADFLKEDEPRVRGHQLEDLIVKATFDAKPLTYSDFTYVASPVFGNCYTFNHNGSFFTSRMLPGYGLEMVLNVESEKYGTGKDYTIPQFVGAVINIHGHLLEPIVEEGVVVVAPNTYTRLGIRKTEYERLGGKYGECVDNGIEKRDDYYYKGAYVKENCENSCLQKAVIERCCCYIKTINRDLSDYPQTYNKTCDGLPELENLKAATGSCGECTIDRRNQLDYCVDERAVCMQQVWDQYNQRKISCSHCYEECVEGSYEISTNMVPWPSTNYMIYDLIPSLTKDTNKTISEESIKENYVNVEINYESMSTTIIREVPIVGDAEFVAELESLAGFWVCWSVWTMFQFFEFLTDLLVVAIRKCKKMVANRKTPTTAPKASASNDAPSTSDSRV